MFPDLPDLEIALSDFPILELRGNLEIAQGNKVALAFCCLALLATSVCVKSNEFLRSSCGQQGGRGPAGAADPGCPLNHIHILCQTD